MTNKMFRMAPLLLVVSASTTSTVRKWKSADFPLDSCRSRRICDPDGVLENPSSVQHTLETDHALNCGQDDVPVQYGVALVRKVRLPSGGSYLTRAF